MSRPRPAPTVTVPTATVPDATVPDTTLPADVTVIGGGLAGIAAALRCADDGARVTLLEGRPRLGGLASSFRRGELTVDNGQHVFLRCCTAYRGLLERIGATRRTVLQRRLDVTVLRPDGRHAQLRRLPAVPAPGHLGAALAGYGLLSPADRVRAARAALALRRLDPQDAGLDRDTLGAFLRRHGQNDATVQRLWGVLAVATLNLEPDDASLALAAKVFRTGLLDRAAAGDIGYADAPLGELHHTLAGRALRAAGVDVRLGHRVEALEPGRVRVSRRGEARELPVGPVVLAVPPRAAVAIAPGLARSPIPAVRGACELETSPIVNVHVVYDRAVTDLAFAAAVDSPVQWFFDRTASSGLPDSPLVATSDAPGDAQYLAVTVSAADELVDRPAREILDRYEPALAALLPRARDARVLDAFVTRERHATFRQAAGTLRQRPDAESGLDNVWLAGSWTATGWPDTMESAVRSGTRAAESALQLPAAELVRTSA